MSRKVCMMVCGILLLTGLVVIPPPPVADATDPVKLGAIRWDAYHGGNESVYKDTMYTMSPTKWRYRWPFYAVYHGVDDLDANAATQTVMDQEIAYAKNAGLDYWAFVRYSDDDAWGAEMNASYNYYLSSTHQSDVNFSFILTSFVVTSTSWPNEKNRIKAAMLESSYQKVDGGRPLLYLFDINGMLAENGGSWTTLKGKIDELRGLATGAGLANPYIVAMGFGTGNNATAINNLGLDAMSQYTGHSSPDASWTERPYATLASQNRQLWDGQKSSGKKVIPVVNAGWNNRPIDARPTSWYDPDPQTFYTEPTPGEFAANVQKAVDWTIANPSSTNANSVLIYAWNEWMEGGYILPTLEGGSDRLNALLTVDREGSGIVGEWKLDEYTGTTVKDNSFTGNNGSLVNGAGWAPGVQSSGAILDGVNDYVNIPDHAALDGMGKLTVSAWVKMSQLPSQNYVAVGKDSNGQSYRITIGSTGAGHFVVQTTNNAWYSAGTYAHFPALSVNEWVHIVGTYDGTTVRVYVDGQLKGSGANAISGTIVASASPVTAGYSSGATIDYLHGRVDEVQIRNVALSATEVQNLYNSYSGTNLLTNAGFENGTSSWSAQSSTIAVETTNVHTGSQALSISGRTNVWSSATQDIKNNLLYDGQGKYTVSAWAKYASGSDQTIIVVNTVDSSGSHWFATTGATVGSSVFTKLSGTLNITWTGTLSSAIIYTQSSTSTQNMYVDDVSLIKQ